MELETGAEALVHEEEQALIPASSGVRGRGVRASSLLGASFLLVAGAGAVWWRGNERISTRGVIGRSEDESGGPTDNEVADSQCTGNGEDCSSSKCCLTEGSTCYKKNKHWASCNQTCNRHYKWEDGAWVDKGEHIWDCDVVSEEAESPCAADGQSCLESKCCANEGSICYQKNEHWASCNQTCNNNYKWEDGAWVDKGEHIWDCEVVSEEAESAESPCAADGQNCLESKCCANEGSTCYQKDEHWASCNQTCNHNYKWENTAWVDKGEGEHIWDCDVVSEEAETPCAADGQSCLDSKCCANEGSTCYQKSEHWASCNQTCNHNYKWENNAWVDQGEQIWDCTVLSENEAANEDSEENADEIACAADGQNCKSSACCVTEGSSCYQKNEHWASCNQTCNHNYMWDQGAWVDKGEHIWDCDVITTAANE